MPQFPLDDPLLEEPEAPEPVPPPEALPFEEAPEFAGADVPPAAAVPPPEDPEAPPAAGAEVAPLAAPDAPPLAGAEALSLAAPEAPPLVGAGVEDEEPDAWPPVPEGWAAPFCAGAEVPPEEADDPELPVVCVVEPLAGAGWSGCAVLLALPEGAGAGLPAPFCVEAAGAELSSGAGAVAAGVAGSLVVVSECGAKTK